MEAVHALTQERPTNKWLWAITVAAACYIILFLFNYDNAFVHPESIKNESYSLENGPTPKWEDFRRGMNYNIFEYYCPRISRTLSNIFELFDAKFRVWLWRFVPPHPSLTLKVILCLVLTPPLLYVSLRNLLFDRSLSLIVTTAYLCSPGFLSPLTMYFHPGKGILNLVFVVFIFLVSQDYRKLLLQPGQPAIANGGKYLLLMLLLLGCLFWDEAGLFMYVFFPVFFFRLFRAFGKTFLRWAGPVYLSIPVIYALLLFRWLPSLHVWAGYDLPDIRQYRDAPGLKELLMPGFYALRVNFRYLVSDHLHLHPNLLELYSGVTQLLIAGAYHLMVILFLLLAAGGWLVAHGYLARSFAGGLFTGNHCPAPRDEATTRQRTTMMIVVTFGLLLAYAWCHSFLISKFLLVWGAWWYGAPFSLLWCLFIAYALQQCLSLIRPAIAPTILVLLMLTMISDELMFFTCRNHVFKQQSIFRKIFPPDIFTGDVNQYKLFDIRASLARSSENYAFTLAAWRHRAAYRGQRVTYDQIGGVLADAGGELSALRVLRPYDISPLPYDNTTAYLDVELPYVR